MNLSQPQTAFRGCRCGDEGREKPEEGEKVNVLYEGRLTSDNSVFDKSVDPESAFKFTIG